MKKLVLSMVVSFGLSVSANAFDSCSANVDLVDKYIAKADKAINLGLFSEADTSYRMAHIYAKRVMMECEEGTPNFKFGQDSYKILENGLR